jgi:hypothetical protein
MNRESDNIGLVPYNFDPEYLVEEINNRQQLIANTTSNCILVVAQMVEKLRF